MIPGSPLPVPGSPEGQTFSGKSRIVKYANFVKLPHTIFALPFALVGVVLASYIAPVTLKDTIWVIVAFTAARFAAMGFNRIADSEIDALNPRTRMREIPSGSMKISEAIVSVVIASVVFITAAWQLNTICLILSPVALLWVFFYSYTKRFTKWSHLVLGLGLAIAPVGGYLAIAGAWSEPWWMLVALAVAVATWVAGFDILYALQDAEFDRNNKLYSIPAAMGGASAVTVSRVLHIGTVAALAATGLAAGGGWIYAIGVTVAAALLLYEHKLVNPSDLSKLDAAFFTMNGIISMLFFCFVLVERVTR